MLSEIGASAFWEWVAFSEIEPFGTQWENLNTAAIRSTIAEVNRNAKKRSKPFAPKDFMFQIGERPKVQSQEEMLQIVEALNEAFGGKDLRGQRGRPN